MPHLNEKIKDASLENLLEIRRQDKSLNELVEPILKIRIHESNLSEMLEALQCTTRRDREEIMNKFQYHMMKLMDDMPFEKLIDIKKELTYNQLFEQLFNSLSRKNTIVIVDKFKQSGSFKNANFNADLLRDISDLLTSEQWETVLEAFCENSQIYNSFYCPSVFCSLFKESLETSSSIQPYWLSFRKKLNKFSSDDNIDKLKDIIDSHTEI